mgnify:CR=1 FL=1
MSYQDYFNSRMISDPIRLFDCVMPCSGAECVILASEERPKDHRQARLSCHRRRKGLTFRSPTCCRTRPTFGMKIVGERIFSEVKREDIDLFEIYDDYPIAVMIQIEDFGYCKKGEGGKFVDAHDLTLQRRFSRQHGRRRAVRRDKRGWPAVFSHVVEALRQLRGEADGHQVRKPSAPW